MIVESNQQGNARLAMARQNRRYQAQTVQMKKEYNALKLSHERQKKDFLQRDTAHQKRVSASMIWIVLCMGFGMAAKEEEEGSGEWNAEG